MDECACCHDTRVGDHVGGREDPTRAHMQTAVAVLGDECHTADVCDQREQGNAHHDRGFRFAAHDEASRHFSHDANREQELDIAR